MRTYKYLFFNLILTLLFTLTNLYAQDDFREWLKNDQKQYNQYLDETDRAFLNFLEQDWKRFDAKKGMKAAERPKPVTIPIAEEKDKPTEPESDLTEIIKIIDDPKPIPEPVKNPDIISPEHDLAKPAVEFDFFGSSYRVECSVNSTWEFISPVSNKSISKAWEKMAVDHKSGLISQLEKLRTEISLNDWGYVLLIHRFAGSVYQGNTNKQILYEWFLLNKSGMSARVAYQNNNVLLLLPVKNQMFEVQFTMIDEIRHYFIDWNQVLDLNQQIFTYTGVYKDAENLVNLAVTQVPKFNSSPETRSLNFNYDHEDISLDVEFADDVVLFFKEYPQTELTVYLSAGTSDNFNRSVTNSLRPYLEGKTELQAVNFLLRFVQTAFDYKTDDQQFGREKYLVPEETIFYPSSDCEDRSILFSYLVHHLLNLDVILLNYPGHISTAVHFEGNVSGDKLEYDNKTYVICDPTYINADAGMTMPDFKLMTPSVIRYTF
ncbi:MAG: hypothetical protein AB7T22_01055 [Calditrichaceae bacterium]